ncbi:MAG TPA: anti-sigma factor [Candidatus Solibacter sp.]|nr:anti-sigma factor [Candidatus Solibacter sp.]
MTLPENELKHALRRREPPEGFAERVLARVEQEGTRKTQKARESLLDFFTRPILRWATVGAMCAVLVAGGFYYRHGQELRAQRERAQGEAAKQQLMLALRIAGSKLQIAKAKVIETSVENKNREVKE